MKRNRILPIVILCILSVAAACLYTLLGIKEETPLIGTWHTDQSVLGSVLASDFSNEVIVSISYENEMQEQYDNKTVPLYYEVNGGLLTVWQGTAMTTYQYRITDNGKTESLLLTKDDGSTLVLERLSDRPLGLRK